MKVGKSNKVAWSKIIGAAELVGRAKESKFVTNLKAEDETIRYWATIGLGAYKKKLSSDSLSALEEALQDSSASVRIEAANALIRNGHEEAAIAVLIKELEHKNLIVVTHAARQLNFSATGQRRHCLRWKPALKGRMRFGHPISLL